MCWEFCQLTRQYHDRWYLFAIVSIILTNIRDNSLFMMALVLSIALSYVLQADDGEGRGSNTNKSEAQSSFVSGLFLITIPCRTWLMVQEDFYHTVSLLLTVWNADTGALITGRLVQNVRRYIYYDGPRPAVNSRISSRRPSGGGGGGGSAYYDEPGWLRRISPNKSLFGLVGGVVGGTATFVCLPYFWNYIHQLNLAPMAADDHQHYYHPDLVSSPPLLFEAIQTDPTETASPGEAVPVVGGEDTASSSATVAPGVGTGVVLDASAVWIGLSLSFAAVLGDLWESSVKRRYGAKDMGRLLPGHGGVLDRFDSSLVAVLLYQYFIEHAIL